MSNSPTPEQLKQAAHKANQMQREVMGMNNSDELREKLRDLKRPSLKDFRYPIEAYEDDLVELIQQETLKARIKYERSGMAFVHATVIDLFDDKKALKKLDKIVQERLNKLTTNKSNERQ